MNFSRSNRIKALQQASGAYVDGVAGPDTQAAAWRALSDPLKQGQILSIYDLPTLNDRAVCVVWADVGGGAPWLLKNDGTILSRAGVTFIQNEEGMDQPSKWPGESSGITLGYGFDLGFYTPQYFTNAWAKHLTGPQMDRLARVLGVTGEAARKVAPQFQDIHISQPAADEVFQRMTLPDFYRKAVRIFPGMHLLKEGAQTALTSLVYNRGDSLTGPRRAEMAALPPEVQYRNYPAMADLFLRMRRLWSPRSGLYGRRAREAALITG